MSPQEEGDRDEETMAEASLVVHSISRRTIWVRMSVNVAFSSIETLPGAAVWSTRQIEIGE
jgi:hypothetical protein